MTQNEAVSPGGGAAALEALFRQSPTGRLILDTELRILRINLTRPILHEAPTEQIVGRHVTDVYDLSAPDEVEAMLYSVLENGAPARERLVGLRPKGAPGLRALPFPTPYAQTLAEPSRSAMGLFAGSCPSHRDVTRAAASRTRTPY
ncbi:PAS domain-containing protein [Streptomyces broussonetiae]|uniref:PAS domain-containing protein n=1 Tax=Streptomyces broussonetiae TaxID=2686304 RepID=A0A6I6N987_9ACTN|nr:PAS domain-containing protein [Streptomyces broussonetiae]